MDTWYTPIAEPITAMVVKIWSYVPNVVAAIVILIVGLALAKVITSIIVKGLKLSKLDVASEKSGLAKVLKAGEMIFSGSCFVNLMK